MSTRSTPAPLSTRRPLAGKTGALITLLAAFITGCQSPETPPPPRAATAPASPAPAVAESAVNSLLLQYQDSGALLRNGFQIAEEGGIVAFEQFDRWTPIQLRELLQFVETPGNGLSESTTRNLARALRSVLAGKSETVPTAATSKPAAPPKAGS